MASVGAPDAGVSAITDLYHPRSESGVKHVGNRRPIEPARAALLPSMLRLPPDVFGGPEA